ncbi:MAG TPA: hopanoid biosynthesis-associated protein HpnK [Tepidisphaeraceae bacterium]|nr:hopanoid biosynthesis-associated protein HpnK [Tepidisphaeraceae bacterium]
MKLIITADDFGRSQEINRAVLDAHCRGVLTSASLMVTGEAFEEAVEMARRTPTLAIGLHLVVVEGKAALPSDRVPHLVDETGVFPNDAVGLGFRYFFSRAARRELALEVAAQFEKFARTGLPLAHVDGHQHLHIHPAVFPLIVPLAVRYGAGGIRLPRDELRLGLRYDRRRLGTKLAWAAAFGWLSGRGRRMLEGTPLVATPRVYGLMQTGRMEEAYVLALLKRLAQDSRAEESAEIYFHPTYGPRVDALGPNPGETDTLLSPAVRRAIEEGNFELCAYPDLSQRSEASATA